MTNQEIYDRIKELYANDKSINMVFFTLDGDLQFFLRLMPDADFNEAMADFVSIAMSKIFDSSTRMEHYLEHEIIDCFFQNESVDFMCIVIDGKGDFLIRDLPLPQLLKMITSMVTVFASLDGSDNEVIA